MSSEPRDPLRRGRAMLSPAMEAQLIRERRSEEKRRKRMQQNASAPFEAVYVKVWAFERLLLFWMQEHRIEWWTTRQALNVTSSKSFQDVCITTAVTAVVTLFAVGFPIFWMFAYATVTFFAVNLFLRCPRPQVLDQRLVPLSRTSEDVICQEAFSAAIMFGTLGLYLSEDGGGGGVDDEIAVSWLWSLDWAYILQQLLLLAIVMFLSWTRLVACSKYPQQILAGWLLAIPHLLLWHFYPTLYFW